MYRFCLLLLAVWQANAAASKQQLASVQCSAVGIPNCGSCDLPNVDCYMCGPAQVMNVGYTGCTNCPADCAICAWGTSATVPVCSLCMIGYILDTKGNCQSCGSYCTSCTWSTTSKTPTTICNACENVVGITLGTQSNACLQCPSFCASCTESGLQSTTCNLCMPGYFLSSGQCSPCPNYCLTCSPSAKNPTSGVCSACMTGYTVNTLSPTSACLYWPPECKSVNGLANTLYPTDVQCTSCNAGYYWDTVQNCDACNWGCTTCSSFSICLTCAVGFVLQGSSCTPCSYGCDNCNSGVATCSSCMTNWGLQSTGFDSCTQCPPNCLLCSAPGSCTTCDDGYYVSGTGCSVCPSNCETCTMSNNILTCDICDAGYQVSSGVCYLCDTHCTTCSATAGGVTCNACEALYYVSGGSCVACGSGCATCDSLGCTLCENGYYITSDLTCEACIVNDCDWCFGEWNCTKCDTGFYVTGNQQCAECGTDCATCTSPTLCTTCDATYYLTPTVAGANSCVYCDANCEVVGGVPQCNISSACQVCAAGYVTDSYACQKCPAFCTAAGCHWNKPTLSTTCSACMSTYYVSNGACLSCPSGCSTCTASQIGAPSCSQCLANYVLGGTVCYACPTNCFSGCAYSVAFSGFTSTCSVCDAGYVVAPSNGQCAPCSANCLLCNYLSDGITQVCTSCANGYGVIGGVCAVCPFFCETCTVQAGASLLTCTSCNGGYTSNNLPCGQCTSNCVKCSNVNGNMICSQCAPYYVLNAGVCVACPGGCSKCTVQGSQTLCVSGACDVGTGVSADRTQCVVCSTLAYAGCSLCSDAPGVGVPAACTQCLSGYILNFWATACLSTGALSNCLIPGARPYECSAGQCTSPFFWITTGPAKGYCGLNCATCGNIDQNLFYPASVCQVTPNGNYTQQPTVGGCWVARKVVNGQATYARGGTQQLNCSSAFSDESVLTSGPLAGSSAVCCSSGNNCNANLILDGIAGASAVAASIALMMASIFVALFRF